MPENISAKVAAVADETTLVLNAGSEHGVSEGMVFAIVAEQQEISDPDSGESLGNWEVVKARVVVEHVQERMCTVRSPLRQEIDTSGTLSTMMVRHSFGAYGSAAGDRASMQVRATGLAGRPKVRPIEVGDRARLVMEESRQPPAVGPSPEQPVAPDLPSKTYATAATAEAADQAPAEPGQGEPPAPEDTAADAEESQSSPGA